MAVGATHQGEEEDARPLKAITFLKTHGLQGSDIIGGYHARRVAPLMARVLPLYGMTPGT